MHDSAVSRGSWRQVLLGSLVVCAPGVCLSDIQVLPRVSSGLTWSDNFNLAAVNADRQQNLVLEVVPGIDIRQEQSRFRSRLALELRHYEFLQHDIPSRTLKQMSGGAEVQLVRDWLTLAGDGSYGPTLRSPSGTGVYNNWLFGEQNITTETSYRIQPALDHAFRWGRVTARHSQAEIRYKDSALPDSQDRGDEFGLQFGGEEELMLARLGYTHENTTYSNVALGYRYDRAIAELGVRAGRTIRVLGNGGKESDVALDTTAGGLDASFWAAGFEYRPGRENVFRIMGGHRFFGRTLDVAWTRTARIMESSIHYSETPTTQSRAELLDREVIGPIVTDPLPGSGGQNQYLRPGADVFIRKIATATIAIRGRLTRVQILGQHENRDYITAPGRDKIDEYTLGIDRRLGPAWRLRAAATVGKSRLREGSSYDESRYEFGATRQIGRTILLDMSWAHVNRSGAAEPYRANWGRVTLTKRFGDAP